MLFWGMSFIWTSRLLASFAPVTVIFIRLLLSSAFLFGLMAVTGHSFRIRREDILLLAGSAVFNPFLYFLGENFGVKYTSPTVSSVIIATIPLFSPIMAWVFLRERINMINIAGILISFTGVAVMLAGRDMDLSGEGRGVLALFGAVLSAVIFSVFLRKLTRKYSPLSLVAWQNLIGAFLFLPLFLLFERQKFNPAAFDQGNITTFLLLSVFASSLAFVFFARTVRELGVSKANVYSNLIPVFTAIFSYILLGETFTMVKTAGIALVIAGVYLSERERRQA
jgi:drug/metabolite transporter (DMT)-like permease